MQNKGAIKIFAILLALACIFYLSFTWVTRGVEIDAKEFAEGVSASPVVAAAAKAYSNNNPTKELFYIDSVKTKTVDRYLDSVKKQPVYDLLIASYTYEECKKREINLGNLSRKLKGRKHYISTENPTRKLHCKRHQIS